MTQPEQLIEYILIRYLENLDFISNRLSEVKSQSELKSIQEMIVPESILSMGYKTSLKYKNITGSAFDNLFDKDVFVITQDALFGEKVSFNIDLYRERVSQLRDGNSAFSAVSDLVSEFGAAGFDRALEKVAADHGWSPFSDSNKDSKKSDAKKVNKNPTLSFREIEDVILELGKVKSYIDELSLSQSDKAQAHALTDAALSMAQSPSPPWYLVRETLLMLAAISTTLAFVLVIVEKIS